MQPSRLHQLLSHWCNQMTSGVGVQAMWHLLANLGCYAHAPHFWIPRHGTESLFYVVGEQ